MLVTVFVLFVIGLNASADTVPQAVIVTDSPESFKDLTGGEDYDELNDIMMTIMFDKWALVEDKMTIPEFFSISDYHIYVEINGGKRQFVGRPGQDYPAYSWYANSPLVGEKSRQGPEYGNSYKFFVYVQYYKDGIINLANRRYLSPVSNGGQVKFTGPEPMPEPTPTALPEATAEIISKREPFYQDGNLPIFYFLKGEPVPVKVTGDTAPLSPYIINWGDSSHLTANGTRSNIDQISHDYVGNPGNSYNVSYSAYGSKDFIPIATVIIVESEEDIPTTLKPSKPTPAPHPPIPYLPVPLPLPPKLNIVATNVISDQSFSVGTGESQVLNVETGDEVEFTVSAFNSSKAIVAEKLHIFENSDWSYYQKVPYNEPGEYLFMTTVTGLNGDVISATFIVNVTESSLSPEPTPIPAFIKLALNTGSASVSNFTDGTIQGVTPTLYVGYSLGDNLSEEVIFNTIIISPPDGTTIVETKIDLGNGGVYTVRGVSVFKIVDRHIFRFSAEDASHSIILSATFSNGDVQVVPIKLEVVEITESPPEQPVDPPAQGPIPIVQKGWDMLLKDREEGISLSVCNPDFYFEDGVEMPSTENGRVPVIVSIPDNDWSKAEVVLEGEMIEDNLRFPIHELEIGTYTVLIAIRDNDDESFADLDWLIMEKMNALDRPFWNDDKLIVLKIGDARTASLGPQYQPKSN